MCRKVTKQTNAQVGQARHDITWYFHSRPRREPSGRILNGQHNQKGALKPVSCISCRIRVLGTEAYEMVKEK